MEELKIIMEAMTNLGEEARSAFIVWVLCRYALLYLLVTSGIVTAFYFIRSFTAYYIREEKKEREGEEK